MSNASNSTDRTSVSGGETRSQPADDKSTVTVAVGFPSIVSPVLCTRALLDTGALGGNTIVKSVADALVSLGLAEFRSSPSLVCNCNNECRRCTAKIKFTFGFLCERKGKERFVTTEATVVEDNQPYKFIIGRETIKEANLAKRLPSHFFQITDRAVTRLGLAVPQLEVPLSRRKNQAVISVPLSPKSGEGSTQCSEGSQFAQRRVDSVDSPREEGSTPDLPIGESTLPDVAGTRVASLSDSTIIPDVAAINDSPAGRLSGRMGTVPLMESSTLRGRRMFWRPYWSYQRHTYYRVQKTMTMRSTCRSYH